MAIETIDLQEFEKNAENLYEATVIASKRARQINDELKMEINQRLEPVLAKDTEDETIMNQDKLNLSLEFEKKIKPTLQSVDELEKNKLSFRYRDSK